MPVSYTLYLTNLRPPILFNITLEELSLKKNNNNKIILEENIL